MKGSLLLYNLKLNCLIFFYRSKRLIDYIYTDIYCKLSKCVGQTSCSYEHYLVYSENWRILHLRITAVIHARLCVCSQSMPESPESTRTSRSDLTSHLAELDDEDEKLRQDQLQQQRSTIPMAAFNFINSIIGSGIVGKFSAFCATGLMGRIYGSCSQFLNLTLKGCFGFCPVVNVQNLPRSSSEYFIKIQFSYSIYNRYPFVTVLVTTDDILHCMFCGV